MAECEGEERERNAEEATEAARRISELELKLERMERELEIEALNILRSPS